MIHINSSKAKTIYNGPKTINLDIFIFKSEI